MGFSRHFCPIKLPPSGNLEYPRNFSVTFKEKISNFPSYIFNGTCLMCRIALKAMNCTQYPSTICQGHDKRHERSMSSGDLPALISKWLKKREKYSRQRYLWTLCRSVVPWRCTTRFRPTVRLCQLEMVPHCFPIPCTRQDSKGEKSRPLDHMRQIPLVSTSVPPYWLKLRFSLVYILDCKNVDTLKA